MKQPMIPLVITGVLAVGAGVAIAGLPSETPGDQLIITVVPTTTTIALALGDGTVARLPTTTTTTTTVLEATSTSTVRSLSPTTVPVARPLTARAELGVATANGAGVSGVATTTADRLGGVGYVDVVATDSAVTLERSTVFYRAELAAEAIRLAVDLGWAIDQVAPIDAAPELALDGEVDLIAVMGLEDVAAPEEP